MACKCFETTEALLKEHLMKQHGDDIKIDEARWEHSIWLFDGGDHAPVALPYMFKFFKRRKNGELEKRITNGGTNIFMKFCPFCGTEYAGSPKKEEPADGQQG